MAFATFATRVFLRSKGPRERLLALVLQAVKGLRTEQLPQMVSEREPRDGAFGRLLLTLEWQHVRVLEEDSFQVPVVATARCPGAQLAELLKQRRMKKAEHAWKMTGF